MNKVCIIGIGAGGTIDISGEAMDIIAGAEIIYGGRRLLAMFNETAAVKHTIGAKPQEIIADIERDMADKHIVVLASGDPNFFGIAHLLTSHLGSANLRIIPHVSSVQMAFAAAGLSWEDAAFVSLHGKPLDRLRPVLTSSQKIAVLTDHRNNPAVIARYLTDIGISNWGVHLCQDLGTENESCVHYSLEELGRLKEFSELNILILLSHNPTRRHIGLHEDDFVHRGVATGMITKQEVRAVILSKLAVAPADTLWDIGAASGSVAIEASRIASRGLVYAVEKSQESEDTLLQNIRRYESWNVIPVIGEAPECLSGLPDPDGVFIGGSGGRIYNIIEASASRLKNGGRMVASIVVLDNLTTVTNAMKEAGLTVETVLLNISRSEAGGRINRLSPLSPVYIITGVKNDR